MRKRGIAWILGEKITRDVGDGNKRVGANPVKAEAGATGYMSNLPDTFA